MLLSCHKEGVTVCPEYLSGVVNLRAGTLSSGKRAQEWNLRTPVCYRLFKRWGTPVVDLFISKRTFKILQEFSIDLSDTKGSGGDALKVEWSVGLRYAFPSPNLVQLVLGRLVKLGGN